MSNGLSLDTLDSKYELEMKGLKEKCIHLTQMPNFFISLKSARNAIGTMGDLFFLKKIAHC